MGREQHQCHFNGCDSTAEWELHLRLWYKGLNGKNLPLDMKSSAIVCSAHRVACMKSLQTERYKEDLADQLKANNFPAPDFDSVTIEARPIRREKTALEIAMLPRSQVTRCGKMEGEAGKEEQCGMPARWQAVLSVRNIGQNKSHRPNHLLLNLCLCNKHKAGVTVENFTDLKTRSLLTGKMAEMNMAMPDWKTAELQFEEMTDSKMVDPAEFSRKWNPHLR